MIILGLNTSHCATACLLVDGKIVSCISEERLSRIKNHSGLPVLSVKEVLRIASLTPGDVDYLVLSFEDPKVSAGFTVLPEKVLKENSWASESFWTNLKKLAWRFKEELLSKVPASRNYYDTLLPAFYKIFLHPKLKEQVLAKLESEIGIPREKIIMVDHHTAHAYSAYFSMPNYWEKPTLVLTLDAMGDGVCSTVSVAKNGSIKRIATTPAGNSIGDLYAFVTAYLGMKMGEHEYKVMGLAPYAGEHYYEKAYEKLKSLVWLNKDLTFGTKYHSQALYKLLPRLLAGERFDNISAAIQKLTEELITSWVKEAVGKTGIGRVACGGGVFMNVKANQKIWELPEVESLFIMPSCGDESTAIGAAYKGYEEVRKDNKYLPRIEPIKDLYFGPEFSDKDILNEISKKRYKKFKITKPKNIEKKVAALLVEGYVVARLDGRMEWGARALGNRSILANPERLDVIREINSQIKSRDFWMPFAPAILEEVQHKYFVNPKKVDAPYMIVTFDSTRLGRDKFKAAMHQYDFTLRPQVVRKEWNPPYWRILNEFEKMSGIGGVLNTSFNLHGYPIVCSPQDALEVFEKSGLKYLVLGKHLVSKSDG